MRPPSADEAHLTAWLQRLVALLLSNGGPVARLLVTTVGNRRAVLVLDDARLALSATLDTADSAGEGAGFAVQIEPAEADAPAHVRTRAEVLRQVLDGRVLLDAVVADGRLDVRAALPDLLAFHELVHGALALGPQSPALQALWREFLDSGPGSAMRCNPLDEQPARHGQAIHHVPASVRQARSPLFEAGGLP